MRSASSIIKRYVFLVLALGSASVLFAQENSPYSRYGLGDIYPQQNISSRGMGGISAALTDWQTLNTVNPASYGDLRTTPNGGLVSLDIGLSIDARTLHSANPVKKYNSTNFIPSYFQFGTPLGKKHWGLVFGLKPVTRINYSVDQRISKTFETGYKDSVQNLYEGSGGLNQVFVGLGKRFGNFSIGVNTGYHFGRREISTKVNFLNDTVSYESSNSANTQTFGGFFVNGGLQYQFKLSDKVDQLSKQRNFSFLRLGLSGTLQNKLNVNAETLNETFVYNADGAIVPIDTVSYQTKAKGTINLPSSYTAGFMFIRSVTDPMIYKWGFGADYSATNWAKDYRVYGQPDMLNDSWMFHVGTFFTPNPITGTGLWQTAIYRLGFYTGKDYMDPDGNGLKVSAFTLGAGFRVRRFHSYDNQYTIINAAAEFGKRGSSVNNVTENFFKFSLGFSLGDIWFIKRKYD